jgi:hypothetical protein
MPESPTEAERAEKVSGLKLTFTFNRPYLAFVVTAGQPGVTHGARAGEKVSGLRLTFSYYRTNLAFRSHCHAGPARVTYGAEASE